MIRVDTTRDSLISIVTPVYNAANFLEDTIKTVQAQTYDNWELILINDQSIDNSVAIIKKFQKDDTRIKLINLKENSGAAVARNAGTESAKGKYLAFLDADDLWAGNKLEVQVSFMFARDSAFTYTSYYFADERGVPNGKKVAVPTSITYKQALRNHIIWTSTVMIDLTKISKSTVFMPDIRRGQDAATWWKILKTIQAAHGINEILAYYRRAEGTLSANKLKALRRTWHLLKEVENLGYGMSSYNFICYVYNAVRKRI